MEETEIISSGCDGTKNLVLGHSLSAIMMSVPFRVIQMASYVGVL